MSAIEPGCRVASISIASGLEIYLIKSIGEDKEIAKPFELLVFEVDELESLVEHLQTNGVNVDIT